MSTMKSLIKSLYHQQRHFTSLVRHELLFGGHYVYSASAAAGLTVLRSRCMMISTDAVVSVDEPPEELEVKRKRPRKEVACPENARVMKVSVIGVPNAGKSTIINALTDHEVCPVSSRPHTTRKNQKATYLDENTQLVFVDTPGLVSVKEIKKFAFTEEFAYGPEKSIGSSHLIAVVHDVSFERYRDKLDFRIKGVLQKFPDKKAILILNKVDAVKRKGTLLDSVRYLTAGMVGGKPLPIVSLEDTKQRQSHLRLDTEQILAKAKRRYDHAVNPQVHATGVPMQFIENTFSPDEIRKGIPDLGWPHFHDIFMVSALKGDGIPLLRRYMTVNAVEDKWFYEADTLTDVPPSKLVLKLLQAKFLDRLPQEVPFKIKLELEQWDETDSGILYIVIKVKCPKERYKWRIIGTGGSLIKQITTEAEASMSKLLNQPVNLVINPVHDKALENLQK